MAGHSKWANIRHRKAGQDAARGKLFTKLAKEITVAAKLGGDDLDSNARLRAAVTKARSQSMPRDNIERAIKKGVGGEIGDNWSEKVYEGYGPGGVAVVVECLTDNVNRTVSEVRHAFSRAGGNLGTEGSVSYMFHKKGQIVYNRTDVKNFDALFELALEHGADEVDDEDTEVYAITCAPETFVNLKEKLDTLEIEPIMASVTRIPENHTPIEGKKAESMNKMIDTLEDCDDVQNVYHNAEFPTTD